MTEKTVDYRPLTAEEQTLLEKIKLKIQEGLRKTWHINTTEGSEWMEDKRFLQEIVQGTREVEIVHKSGPYPGA